MKKKKQQQHFLRVMYTTPNDLRPQMIPKFFHTRPEMIPEEL